MNVTSYRKVVSLALVALVLLSAVAGAGVVAADTVQSDGNTPTIDDITVSSDGNGTWTVNVNATASSNGTLAETYVVVADGPDGDSAVINDMPGSVSTTLTGLNDSESYNFKVYVVEEDGDQATKSIPSFSDPNSWTWDGTFSTSTNTAPAVYQISTESTVTAGENTTIDVIPNDEYPNGLTYDFDFDGDGTYEVSDADGQVNHTFASSGSVTIGVRLTDISGLTGTSTTDITVDSATHDVTFDVTDSNGTAIENATVNINNQTVQTDSNGTTVVSLADGDYSFEVSADGYVTNSNTVTVNGSDTTAQVTLSASSTPTPTPDDSGGGGAIPGGDSSTAVILVVAILLVAAALMTDDER